MSGVGSEEAPAETTRRDAHVSGVATLPNGTYDEPELTLAVRVMRDATDDADCSIGALDAIYMPKPRPWTDQGFFSTLLAGRLGLELAASMELYTGGTSGGHALQRAVRDVRAGRVDRALVLAVERNSTVETDRYLSYVLSLFDRSFQSPAGPTIPGIYAMSLQRYCHEYEVDREAIAAIVAKNRRHATRNPDALFDETLSVEEVLDSRPVAEPLRLYECPAPCDGAAALVVTGGDATATADHPVRIAGIGYSHAPTHFLGPRDDSLARLPAIGSAAEEALAEAEAAVDELDLLEPYAPFPHVEALITEELGVFDRGDGAAACVRGETAANGRMPVSPSGGCIGRGHPAMVSPALNHVAAVRQLRGTAPVQVSGTETVLTTTEHGHVDGVTATIFGGVS